MTSKSMEYLENKIYYHSNRQRLCPGEFIEPGNYGRLVREAGESGPHWNREQVLERVRAEMFPNKPSRLNACFVTHDINTAKFYHRYHCAEGQLYQVMIVDRSLPWHIGDFNCVQPLPKVNKTMEQIAEAYWSYNLSTNIEGFPNLKCEEIVTSSGLKVVNILETNC